jgi:hypothetical protein
VLLIPCFPHIQADSSGEDYHIFIFFGKGRMKGLRMNEWVQERMQVKGCGAKCSIRSLVEDELR